MYVIGIDVGTTGTKAMLIDDRGVVLECSYRGYELIKSGNNQVEQKAEDWWEALVSTVRECTKDIKDKDNILAISISAQGASLVPVAETGEPLSNVIVWMDNRGVEQQKALLNTHPAQFYYEKTGWKLSAGGNLIQIKWLKDNNPDLFQRSYKILSTMEYINYKLTGKYIIDPTCGGITQLMDIRTGKWDRELLLLAGINEKKLADILDSGAVVGELTVAAAEELGLNTSVKVINGGHDQYCAAIGAGAVGEGELLLSTGTAWVILGTSSEPIFVQNACIAPGRHIVKGVWGGLSSNPTGGVCIEWFKENFGLRIQSDASCEKESYSLETFREIDQKASLLMKKAENLFFYPYYNGSRFNISVKASLLGIGLEHDRYAMALAIMEGVAFEANYAIEEFKQKGYSFEHLRMLGGASKSQLWKNIIAAVVGVPVVTFSESEAACIGAGIIAGVGCGMFESYAEGYRQINRDEVYTVPDRETRDFYLKKYERYKKGIEFIEDYYKATSLH